MRGLIAVALAAIAACGVDSGPEEDLQEYVVVSEGASNPTVALDPDSGELLVAWTGAAVEGSDAWMVRVGDSGAGEPVRINDVPGDAAPHLQAPAQIVAGSEGLVMVLWTKNTPRPEERFPASDLRVARSTDGGRSFQPAIYLNDDAGGELSSHTFHDMTLLPDGTPVALWLDGRLPPEPDDTDGYEGPEVRMAMGAHHGEGFGENRIVAHDTCPCCRSELVTDGEGTLYAAWRTVLPGSIRDIVVARSVDGGASWSDPTRVHADDWVFEGCPHAGPAMTVDEQGRLHVAWYTGAEGRQGLWYAASVDGGVTFDTPTPLLDNQVAPPSIVSLAADGAGSLWAAWEARSGEGERIVKLWRGAAGSDRPGPQAQWSMQGTNPDLSASAGQGWVAVLDEGAVRVGVAGREGS